MNEMDKLSQTHTHTHRTRARAREMYVWKIVCRDADLNRLMCVYVRVSIWRKSVQYKPKYRIAVFVHAEDTPIHLTHGSPAVLLNAYTHTHSKAMNDGWTERTHEPTCRFVHLPYVVHAKHLFLFFFCSFVQRSAEAFLCWHQCNFEYKKANYLKLFRLKNAF